MEILFWYSIPLIEKEEKKQSGLFALALFATAGFGVNKSMSNKTQLSDLELANVEALAQDKGGGKANKCCPIWKSNISSMSYNYLNYKGDVFIIENTMNNETEKSKLSKIEFN